MKATIKMTALLCALGLMTGAAMAQPGNGMKRMFAGLELTETQKEQIKALHETQRAEMESKRDERQASMKAHREQMKVLMAADQVDLEAVKALKAEGEEKRKAAAEKKLAHKVALLNILTPEQREKFLAREARMHKKGKMGKRGGKKGCKGKKGQKPQA